MIQKMISTIVIMLLIIIVVGWALTGGISIGQDKDFGCYKSHVKECLDCHSRNLTYALCSGFCFEPREDDLNNSQTICSVHPFEDCFELPMECNV